MAWSCRPFLRASARNSGLLAQFLGNSFLSVELPSAPRDLLRRHLGDVLKIKLPVGTRAPDKRRLHAGARSRCRLQHTQRQFQGIGLRTWVLWPTRGIAKWEVGEQET